MVKNLLFGFLICALNLTSAAQQTDFIGTPSTFLKSDIKDGKYNYSKFSIFTDVIALSARKNISLGAQYMLFNRLILEGSYGLPLDKTSTTPYIISSPFPRTGYDVVYLRESRQAIHYKFKSGSLSKSFSMGLLFHQTTIKDYPENSSLPKGLEYNVNSTLFFLAGQRNLIGRVGLGYLLGTGKPQYIRLSDGAEKRGGRFVKLEVKLFHFL